MKVIVRIYEGPLDKSTKDEIMVALEIDALLLTGESDMPPSATEDSYHEMIFEEEEEEEGEEETEEEPT